MQIIELAGPAGAGKSTIRDILTSHYELRGMDQPDIHRWYEACFFAANLTRVAPAFIRMAFGSGPAKITLSKLARMAVISGWHRRFAAGQEADPNMFILDQGPVFMMSQFYQFSRNEVGLCSKWWENNLSKWSRILKGIIWIDAPDDTLIQRARARPKQHGNQTRTYEEAVAFLKDSRRSLMAVIWDLEKRSQGLKVMKYENKNRSAADMAHRIFLDLKKLNSAGEKQ